MVNSEKTIFMKREGEEWIMHGLFVDDMIHAATNDYLRDQVIRECKADFNITFEDVVTTFLRMEIELNKKDIAIHHYTHVRETLDGYKMAVSKFLKSKKGTFAAGGDAGAGGLPRLLIRLSRRCTDCLWLSSSSQHHG